MVATHYIYTSNLKIDYMAEFESKSESESD